MDQEHLGPVRFVGLWFSHFSLGTNLRLLFSAEWRIFFRWPLASMLSTRVGAALATATSAAAVSLHRYWICSLATGAHR